MQQRSSAVTRSLCEEERNSEEKVIKDLQSWRQAHVSSMHHRITDLGPIHMCLSQQCAAAWAPSPHALPACPPCMPSLHAHLRVVEAIGAEDDVDACTRGAGHVGRAREHGCMAPEVARCSRAGVPSPHMSADWAHTDRISVLEWAHTHRISVLEWAHTVRHGGTWQGCQGVTGCAL